MAPGGELVVAVSSEAGPSAGKRIELAGTPQAQVTDASGHALFFIRAGIYVVRAYAIGAPGPGQPFVDKAAEVSSGRTSRVDFFDCTACR